jgi:hypothetical protein
MKEFVLKLTNLFNDRKIVVDTLDLIAHIYLYLLFFSENYDMLIMDNGLKLAYKKLSTEFSQFIETKFDYKLIIIENSKFCDFINEITTTAIVELFASNYKHNYTDLICDSFKNIKDFKQKQKEIKTKYTGQHIINYIYGLLAEYEVLDNIDDKTFLNLFSGFGNLIKCLYDINDSINSDMVTLCDINSTLNIISYANLKINTGLEFENIISTDLIHDNTINNTYDVILSDIPDDIRNITHAGCCEKIKQLKIRGTKSEPLIIQLITTLMNDNGIAITIVPDSLLFGESIQHIETRKYLLSNFKLRKIINVGDKKSIMVWFNDGETEEVFFTDLMNSYAKTISAEQIKNKNYSLYFYNYESVTTSILPNTNEQKSNTKSLNDIITIQSNIENLNSQNEYLFCYKTNQFKIMKPDSCQKIDYVFLTKNESQYNQIYLNYYLKKLFEKNLNLLTKGKTKQLDLDGINSLKIEIPQLQIQNHFVSIFKYNNQMIELNNQQIENYHQLKLKTIEAVLLSCETDKLSNICKISHESNNKNTIVINRNSTSAGSICLSSEDNESSNNNYYLEPLDDKITTMELFHVLKFYESKLKNMSKVNNTINLARNKIENLDIPITTGELKNIENKCAKYDIQIDTLNNVNNTLANYIHNIF